VHGQLVLYTLRPAMTFVIINWHDYKLAFPTNYTQEGNEWQVHGNFYLPPRGQPCPCHNRLPPLQVYNRCKIAPAANEWRVHGNLYLPPRGQPCHLAIDCNHCKFTTAVKNAPAANEWQAHSQWCSSYVTCHK